ncbi:MAG TPA: FKBP-type peptidyl-prolyl cis-trans isomerase [Thermodesulfobacteriota bacterium]|nr:FKBP-type peptidyl-prolyl cis-trans isomerase [Thermodesulfobacteriota bacterium]
MKVLIAVALSIVLVAGCVNAGDNTALKSEKDKVSYSIGLNIGNNFKSQSVDINPDILAKGVKDALSGSKSLMTEKEIQETMAAFQKEMNAKQTERIKALAEKNKKDGEAFLAENKKKEGVKTTASGMQYKIIKAGNGAKPKATDTVAVNYRGTLIDGTEFDSSYKRGEPTIFPLNGIIPGWLEALQLMPVGSKWQLFLPPALAYGERGSGREIGPNAALVFDVELLSINK